MLFVNVNPEKQLIINDQEPVESEPQSRPRNLNWKQSLLEIDVMLQTIYIFSKRKKYAKTKN